MDFSTREVKRLVDEHKKTEDKLQKGIDYPVARKKEIREIFSAMRASGQFVQTAEEEITGKKRKGKDSSFGRLILSTYRYLQGKEYAAHCEALLNRFRADTQQEYGLLRKVNPISWAFSSRKKKTEIIDAFQELSLYQDAFVLDEQDEVSIFNKITTEEALEDFNADRPKYDNTIKSILGEQSDEGLLPIVRAIFSQHERVEKKMTGFDQEVESEKEKIRQALTVLAAPTTYKQLQEISIDEIGKEKKGIRLKALKDAGYTTVASVLATADVYSLASIRGISESGAYDVKEIAREFSNRLMKDAKIQLSYDDQTKEATEVVKLVYKYKQREPLLQEVISLRQKNENIITKDKAILQEIGRGSYWSFYSEEKKEKIKSIYAEVAEILQGDYPQDLYSLAYRYLNKRIDSSARRAWEDFKENAADYNSIIQELAPGRVGSDAFYGLPEDLARQIQDECFFPDGLTCKLREYQVWGVKYILHQKRVLLGDEMGLGKTVQAIATMVSLKNTGATHFAVVCPLSVLSNWFSEIRKHSLLTPYRAYGKGLSSAFSSWMKNGGVFVTTYESLAGIKLGPYFRFSQLIVDEAHYIKNPDASRTGNAIAFSKHAERLLFLTGTPLENKVEEMISLVRILNPTLAGQIEQYAFISTSTQFREKIVPVYYRRKREDVLSELPEKTEKEEWLDLSPDETREYYNTLRSKNIMSVRRLSWNYSDLQQSTKAKRFREIVETAKENGRKVLAFSYFLDTVQAIINMPGLSCVQPINGKVAADRRQEIIKEFEQAPAGTVLCAQIQSGGTGLNIQAASVVILCEPQFKPSIEDQAISRAYRMGQSSKVFVHRLLCRNTIEERIWCLLAAKREQFDAFADESVAARSQVTLDIDEKTGNRLIEEELERINKEKSFSYDAPIIEWESAKDTYIGEPISVTKRIKQVAQVPDTYVKVSEMQEEIYEKMGELHENENVGPALIGLAVDYLTRLECGGNAEKAFEISIQGAMELGDSIEAKTLLNKVKRGLDDESIISAIKLVGYDCAYRGSPDEYVPVSEIEPDEDTIENVRYMVQRARRFFAKNALRDFGVTFGKGYTRVIGYGDADFLTEDTLWDMKVKNGKPTKDDTFQLLIYYLMGKHSQKPEWEKVKYIGIYNPRLDVSYRFEVKKLDPNIIKRVEEEVIGY